MLPSKVKMLADVLLSEEAYDIIATLIDGKEDDEYLDIADYINALEDGEALKNFGFNDQNAVEEAYDFLNQLKGN